MKTNKHQLSREQLSRFIVASNANIVFNPVAKVASTAMKRIAALVEGRAPARQSTLWESKAVLAIHNNEFNGFRLLSDCNPADQATLLRSNHWLRLAVTRHPGERLVSFWFDKLYLQESAYQPLAAMVREMSVGTPDSDAVTFADFIRCLDQHWSQLSKDCHLMPQTEHLCINLVSYSHYLDRSDLAKKLPVLLKDRLPEHITTSIGKELHSYQTTYQQRLSERWQDYYSQDTFAIVQRRYSEDFSRFAYSQNLHAHNRSRATIQALTDGCLIDAQKQIQERNEQIGYLQTEIRSLQAKLANPACLIGLRSTASDRTAQTPTSQHHSEQKPYAELYRLLAAGKPEAALASAEQLLHTAGLSEEGKGEIHYLQGVASNLLVKPEQALRYFEQAEQHGFLTAYVLFNGGNACRTLGNQEEAQRLFRQALELMPDFPECQHNLCLSLYDCKDYRQAEIGFRLLLRDHPDYVQASFCLGNLLREIKRFPEAVEAYKLAIEHQPTYVDAWNNLGLVYGDLNQPDLALSAYLQSLSIDASFPHARQNLAQAYVLKKDYESARTQFQLLSRLNVGPTQNVLALQGEISCLLELDQYEQALELANQCSNDERVRLMARLHVVPVLYANGEERIAVRQRWRGDLERLEKLLQELSETDEAYSVLWAHAWSLTNFYIAYQMEDDKPLQQSYGNCLRLVLKHQLAEFMQARPSRQDNDQSPLRIGVISPHLRNHNGSIWSLGWLEQLAGNNRYQIYCYNVGEQEDNGTARFAELGTYRHLPLTADDPIPSLNQIISDDLDLLIFTDIGMHPRSKVLATLRLARVQAQGWGHPITSGSQTMDYFLSGELMESEHSDGHYTEILWRLPGTGLVYEKPVALHDGSSLYEKLGLPTDRPLLLSLQSTFKYIPEYDHVFARIIQENPEVMILFAGHMGCRVIADRLAERLASSCQQMGIDASQNIRILPRLDHPDFMGLFAIAHHAIDTIGWNGGNSSFQSFSLHCPVVTLPTAFMRGRHTVAMLKTMGIDELIAADIEDYVAISSRLLKDQVFYDEIRRRIADKQELLFKDRTIATAFETFVRTVCRS